MTADDELAHLAARAGLHASFRDMNRIERTITSETRRVLLEANGLPALTLGDVRESLARLDAEASARFVPDDVIIQAGRPFELTMAGGSDWTVQDEDSLSVLAEGRSAGLVSLPPLDVGVYLLQISKGPRKQTATLLSAPARAPSVAAIAGAEKQWGVVAALYGLQTAGAFGLADFRDLGDLAGDLGKQGAAFLGINPVHALGWMNDDTISPYSPTHRGFLTADHIAIDPKKDPERPSAPPGSLLDYAAHRARHRPALVSAFAAFEAEVNPEANAAFDAFVSRGGDALQDFARFEAWSMVHGADVASWPANLRDRATAATVDPPPKMRFHLWLQWLADQQLRAAQTSARSGGMALGLYLDLAVGARLGGAEHWANAAARADGVSVGAPPDDLSPAGQNWGLTAYAPRKLIQTRYRALRQILRASMQHCGILRIDHVLGLNRSFWLPLDGTPGGYISQPFESLLALVAIEAHLSGTVIVGEDLGLVPSGFRSSMAQTGLYGYTVLQFERTEDGGFRRPEDLRPQTLACFGTHDTPTLRGYWEGHDIDWWHKLGWIKEEDVPKARSRRSQETRDLLVATGTPREISQTADDVRQNIHSALATGPTALSAVQLDDILGLREAQNLPGTVDEHPNWRRVCPASRAELAAHPGLVETATDMRAAGRGVVENPIERTSHGD
ncbi:MAG: 4-alpha-glucanotransferase [Pseudomonadota bacterium]